MLNRIFAPKRQHVPYILAVLTHIQQQFSAVKEQWEMTDVLKNEVRHDMRQCYERVNPDFMRLYIHFAPSYLARMRQVLGSYTALVKRSV